MRSATKNSWCVYILECGDGSLYTGITNNLSQRIVEHQAGTGSKYTRSHLPVKLVFCENVVDRSMALKLEAAIKKIPKSKKLHIVVSGNTGFLYKGLEITNRD